MDMVTDTLNGFKVIAVQPDPIYSSRFRQTKSKVGKRWIKVRRFIRWEDRIKDGQVIIDEAHRTLLTNEATKHELKMTGIG